MRLSFTSLALLFSILASQAQSVFFESFEDSVPGQMTQEYLTGVLDWNIVDGANIGAIQPLAVDGDSAAFFFYPDYSGDETALSTPDLDLSAGSFRLGFWHVQGSWAGDQNSLSVQISNDGGANWADIEYFFSDVPTWTYREYQLADYATLTATTRIRFVGMIQYGFAIGLDAINVFAPEAVDQTLTSIISPATGCDLGNELVGLVVFNDGIDTIFGFDAGYLISGNTVIESFTDSIAPGDVDTIYFAATADMSAYGPYDITAWTSLPGDLDTSNDTLTTTVENLPAVGALPYLIDFESGTNGWTSTGTNGIWALGDPEGALIDTANSGINCWHTNLGLPTYNDSQYSYLTSPCFDMSATVLDPILSFAIAFDSEEFYDGTWVEVSTDGGTTWNVVGGYLDSPEWYNVEAPFNGLVQHPFWGGMSSNFTAGWMNVQHLLTGAAGQSSVRFRFVFSSDPSVIGYEGFAIDDISVEEQPAINVEVFTINSPQSGCVLGNAEALSVTIVNAGSDPLTDVELFYTLDDNNAISETFTVNLNALDTALVTFTTTLDLSVIADHSVTVWAVLPNDGNLGNDTVLVVASNYPLIAGLPYFIDFENGNGGWSSTGYSTFGQWELGDPTGNIIDDAYSGTNCWATNLNTLLYQNEEFTYLTSPCIDLDTLSDDPILSFAIQYNSENGWDAAWVETSIDGGLTWAVAGSVGQGINWYSTPIANNQLVPGPSWTGNSGINSEWVIAEIILNGTAGSSDVKIRFGFSSDFSVNGYEGFALDDISIHPQPHLDLSMLRMESPSDNCFLDTEPVTITFWNKGLNTVQNFPVGYSVDGGADVMEVCPLVLAQGDTATYTFNTQVDLSAAGAHSIDVFTALVGDEYTNNDTLSNLPVINYQNTPQDQTLVTNVPINSTNVAGVTSPIYFCGLPTAITGCFRIASVTIASIQHNYIGGLRIYLVSPNGTTVPLSLNNGGGGVAISNVVFNDDAATNITTQVNVMLPGTYTPQQPLSTFYDGQDPNGAWTLFIQDDFFGDVGVLLEWGMSFTYDLPFPTLGADFDMCVNYTDSITVQGGPYNSVIWSNGWVGNTVVFEGADLGVGTHQLSAIVDQNGCTGFSDTITVTVNACTGVDETAAALINIYPNPSSGKVNVEIPNGLVADAIVLTDAVGRELLRTPVNTTTDRKILTLDRVAKGVYMISVVGPNLRYVERLVIN